MKQYRSELDRLQLTAQSKDALVEALLGQEKRDEGRAVPARRVLRPVLLAACLTVALAVGALAVSPTLRETLSAALGSFQPYSQSPENITAVDRGIEMRVVSALMDESDGTAYLEVKDLEGDRLGMDMRLDVDVSGRHLSPMAYDAETRTALFALDLGIPINEVRMGRAEELVLTCEALHPGRVELPVEEIPLHVGEEDYIWNQGINIPKSLLTDRVLKTRPLTEAEKSGIGNLEYKSISVLLPDQTPADLGSPYVSLSSAGYDEEGHFHIQLALAQGVYTTDYGLGIDFAPGFWFETLGQDYITYRRTLLEGGRYYDVTFLEIGPEAWALLPDASVTGAVYTQPPIEGEWTLSFPYVTQPVQEVTMGVPFAGLENVTLEKVQLSAMSLRLTLAKEADHRYMGGQQVHLFCKDGTILHLDNLDSISLYRNEAGEVAEGYTLTYEQHQGSDGWQYCGERRSWSYPQAVAPKDVVGFSWGLWYVPLDGGEGTWLQALPQPTE